MNDLAQIPGIEKSSLELLEAAGFLSARALAESYTGLVAAELRQANEMLRICGRAPSDAEVSEWIGRARQMTGITVDEPVTAAPPSAPFESTPEGASLLSKARLAVPLPAKVLMDHQLAVADIPPALPLNEYNRDFELRTTRHLPENHAPITASGPGQSVKIAEGAGHRRKIDTSRVRSIDEMAPTGGARPVEPRPQDDRIELLRAPRPSTNKGRDPQSRRFIRGVLHSDPAGIYAGALMTLLIAVIAPLGMISSVLLLLSSEIKDHFAWVPGWIIVFPLMLPLVGIAYLIFGLRGRCRVCGQGLFRHHPHLKNSKAHRVRGLGYIIPLCFHILLFHWFRCTHCGTPVRLKE